MYRITKHPELKYFNEYCTDKVIQLFNEYPCNCRQFEMNTINPTTSNNVSSTNLDDDATSMSNHDLQAIFINFDNLQGIYLGLDSNITTTEALIHNETFQLSNSMFEESDLQHLKILVIDGLNIDHISNKINQLKRLEIFMLNNILTSLDFPFDSVSKLDALKVIRISQTTSMLSVYVAFFFEVFFDRSSLCTVRYVCM